MLRVIGIAAISTLGVMLLISGIFAQDGFGTTDARYAPIYVGVEAVAGGNMHLRGSPPIDVAGWYYKGEHVGVLLKGETVSIIKIIRYPSLLGMQSWLEIERHDPTVEPKFGWVYYGDENYFNMKMPPE